MQAVKSRAWLQPTPEAGVGRATSVCVWCARYRHVVYVYSIVTGIRNFGRNCYLRRFEDGYRSRLSGSGDGEECARSCEQCVHLPLSTR